MNPVSPRKEMTHTPIWVSSCGPSSPQDKGRQPWIVEVTSVVRRDHCRGSGVTAIFKHKRMMHGVTDLTQHAYQGTLA